MPKNIDYVRRGSLRVGIAPVRLSEGRLIDRLVG